MTNVIAYIHLGKINILNISVKQEAKILYYININ